MRRRAKNGGVFWCDEKWRNSASVSYSASRDAAFARAKETKCGGLRNECPATCTVTSVLARWTTKVPLRTTVKIVPGPMRPPSPSATHTSASVARHEALSHRAYAPSSNDAGLGAPSPSLKSISAAEGKTSPSMYTGTRLSDVVHKQVSARVSQPTTQPSTAVGKRPSFHRTRKRCGELTAKLGSSAGRCTREMRPVGCTCTFTSHGVASQEKP
jgi:hypothetical protein